MTAIILGVGLLVAFGVIVYLIRETRIERALLLDRIQAPAAASMTAYEQAINWHPPEAAPDIYTDPVLPERHDDLSIDALLEDK